MKVIFKTYLDNEKTSFELKEKVYPRNNIEEEIVGLSSNIEIYYINETKEVIEDSRKYKLVQLPDEFTTEKFHYCFICNRRWVVQDKSSDEVIQDLDNTLYNLLDMEYPLVERIKDSDEMAYGTPDIDKKKEITDKKNWEQSLRKEKRNRIKDYLDNGIFPSFEFESLETFKNK